MTQSGNVFTLDGVDDQCGASQQASVVGLAFSNPDGSFGAGLTTVLSPGGTPVHLDVTISPATLSGTWRDSAGNAGSFVLTPGAGIPGAPRPVPLGGIAPGSITALQIAPGAVGPSQLALGAVGTTHEFTAAEQLFLIVFGISTLALLFAGLCLYFAVKNAKKEDAEVQMVLWSFGALAGFTFGGWCWAYVVIPILIYRLF